MTLREEVKVLSGNKRRFFLLRVADMDTKTALKLCGIKRDTYSSWLQNRENNTEFRTLYRRRDEFAGEYKDEAIQLLRRDNQRTAAILESRILEKVEEELESGNIGEGSILRSNLVKEIFSKLMGDLDTPPKTPALTWQQRIEQIVVGQTPQQLPEGEIIDAEFEADSESQSEYKESQLIQESEQTSNETQEKA